jgi:hypothetical protein
MMAARMALALVLASAVLFAGARAGGAFARGPQSGPVRQTDDSAYPERAGQIPVGDALEVSGQPMQLSLFYTSDPPERVVRFYAEAFRARGLLPVIAGDTAVAHVSAFPPESGLQRFISAVPQPDGQTLVLIGATNPRRPPRLLHGTAGVSFPVPPEHRALFGFQSRDNGARAESAQFVSALAPHEVVGFYRQALAAQGYAENREAAGGSLLTFSKPGATLSVALQKLDHKQGAAVFITRIEGDAQ